MGHRICQRNEEGNKVIFASLWITRTSAIYDEEKDCKINEFCAYSDLIIQLNYIHPSKYHEKHGCLILLYKFLYSLYMKQQ